MRTQNESKNVKKAHLAITISIKSVTRKKLYTEPFFVFETVKKKRLITNGGCNATRNGRPV